MSNHQKHTRSAVNTPHANRDNRCFGKSNHIRKIHNDGGIAAIGIDKDFDRFSLLCGDTVILFIPFEDIKGTDWFFEDAVWAYSYKDGILRGYSETEWQPLTPIHSVSVAVTLRRMDGADLTPYYTGEEDGLDNSAWYVAAARWATVNGILPAPFGGYAPLTRGEYAVILRNYLRYRGIDVTPSQPAGFSDSDQMTADEREAFQFLNEAGIYRGDASGAMLPKNNLHRAHLAALLHRLSDYIIKVETANN